MMKDSGYVLMHSFMLLFLSLILHRKVVVNARDARRAEKAENNGAINYSEYSGIPR